MPIKLPLGEFAPMSLYTDAINFARINGAHILSNSWNGGTPWPALQLEIEAAINSGKIVLFSASNSANHYEGDDGEVQFPANLNIPKMIVVGASDKNNLQANYSPSNGLIDISAPSHSAYTHQIPEDPYETFNIWTLDIPGESYGHNKWKDWSTFLPAYGEVFPSTGTNYSSYTARFGGTSAATPMVGATIALMKSINPCLTVDDIIKILEITTDKVGGYSYNWNPSKPGHSRELGFGKLNTYRAVKMALDLNTTAFDLYMKDNPNDVGLTGVSGTGGGGDKSPDIWVRNQPDGHTNFTHQNPEFTNGAPCYVYVKVTNKSCHVTEGTNNLKLYWSKAATSSSWPENWDGSMPDVGNMIDNIEIPTLNAGESAILQFTWNMLDPHLNNTWNSCLLARIESGIDNQTFYSILADDITENNNVSIRNVTVVDQIQGLGQPGIAQVLSGNVTESSQNYDFNIDLLTTPNGKPNIFNEAEVTITFNDLGWQLFENSNALSTSGIRVIRKKTILITDSIVRFTNISFPAKTRIPLTVNVNFLSKTMTPTIEYAFTFEQYDSDSHKKLGTETFEILKGRTDSFKANAGNDITVEANSDVELSAELITENALYNWYNDKDSLIYSGCDFSIVQQITQGYKLEVIRLADGLKDYDEKIINVTKKYLKNISPVPVTNLFTVEYDISELQNAYLSIVNINSSTSINYVLDANATSKIIDASLWQSGLYNVYLINDGLILESQTISVAH